MEESMEASVSPRWANEQYLLDIMMKQLGLTKEDLDKDPSWIKSKVRDANIDKVLGM
jgi:hypothetical protein